MKRLERKDGYRYTQSADVSIEDRIIVRSLVIADTASESDWKLITEAESDEIRRQQEESMNEQQMNN